LRNFHLIALKISSPIFLKLKMKFKHLVHNLST